MLVCQEFGGGSLSRLKSLRLNLLIAVLSTAHDAVIENAVTEFHLGRSQTIQVWQICRYHGLHSPSRMFNSDDIVKNLRGGHECCPLANEPCVEDRRPIRVLVMNSGH